MNWQGMRYFMRGTRGGGLAVVIAIIMMMTGCSLISETRVDNQLFRQHMVACTQAISHGDLQQAEVHLSEARPMAVTNRQKRQIRSLQALIEGAEALMNGNGDLAEAHFSRIEDPYLRREVRIKARQVNLKVPITPLAAYGGGR
ncbi:hypothetical protein [Poriferisphaera sp. WC338]|uniref:hypothetical protein n=1 Tax=Poriferisphaera sp. WC338 TaxID=3425129 RepID=UPI003D812B53